MKFLNKYLLLLLFVVMVLFSCKKESSNTIKIGILEGPSAISFIQMIDKTPVVNGKRVEFIVKSDPQQIQALMMRHELDFAVLPTVMAANLYNKGIDFKILACPVWGTLYFISGNSQNKSFEDLSGQTISVFGQGATSDILLQKKLKDLKVNDVKIDYSYTGNAEISEALLHKKIANAIVSEPMVSILMAKDTNLRVISKLSCEVFDGQSEKDIFAQTAFVVSGRFIEKYSHSVSSVSSAYSASCQFVNEHPDQAAKLLIKHGYMHNLTVARHSLGLCNIRYKTAFTIERELMQYLRVFSDFNPQTIGGKLPNRDFIYQPQQ